MRIFTSVLLAGLTTLAGCQSGPCGGASVSADKLKGTWRVAAAEGALAQESVSGFYVFSADSARYRSSTGEVESVYALTMPEGALVLKSPENSLAETYCLQLENDTLRMALQLEGDLPPYTYKLVRAR